MTVMNKRAHAVLQTTADHYGLRSPHICKRCNRRQIGSDILQGYCGPCADALAAKARSKQMENSPLFAPLEKL